MGSLALRRTLRSDSSRPTSSSSRTVWWDRRPGRCWEADPVVTVVIELIGAAVHRRPWRADSRATIGVVVAVAALAPAPAGAVIVPKRSIAGIALHMTRSDVRAQLGKPASRFRRPFGASGSSFPAWRYASKRLTIVFVDGDSLFVDTRDATEK